MMIGAFILCAFACALNVWIFVDSGEPLALVGAVLMGLCAVINGLLAAQR